MHEAGATGCFGLPSADLLERVRSWGAKILSSATTVDEARWLEAHGVDAVIAHCARRSIRLRQSSA